MAKTFLVTDSLRSARRWCADNGRSLNDVEIVMKPEDTYGHVVKPEDRIVLNADRTTRHTIRAASILQSLQSNQT